MMSLKFFFINYILNLKKEFKGLWLIKTMIFNKLIFMIRLFLNLKI